ncbi:nucleic acid binding protein [marine gamma proteobacterium HTCC2207]|jgi:predicted RNA-binding protein (virulence factor B family)|uniref:Nucleic acid binding protein n=1 Tax=gamma proteobacterium HTCC2207 TaxID=314287 RepID=Q1YQC3_9GAMM|nr:nucleic acid binding protein [marine gamma proteobacterium HTCC2207] [gamma proteobacterium HTCC2207]MBT5106454.1 GntR family transcriptional regulator [Porticoccaceae bacterium]MBT6592677.1 GntR family transcriptional regulator [Porticoccaceae bacterium]MDC0589814.1 S1-like domain-containing RNA-binding protein [Porticoccaceae bacterium]MDG1080144.1 S1-like domain-containing RNA-binding protein [Porticoccaceae bacterium]
MAQVGRFNKLEVIKEVDFGVYLDGGELDSILLPQRYVPEDCEVGDWIDVFLYFDSEDLLIATTEKPRVEVGRCEMLKVIDINNAGAFMDWGLPKDLLVPYSEQLKPMEVGYSYVVYAFHDQDSDRIAASTRLQDYLAEESVWVKPRQAVDLLIAGRTDLGYKAVINDQYLGLIFRDDAFRPLKVGERLPGFIKSIRSDGKIDLVISQGTLQGDHDLGEQIIERLRASDGVSTLTDKSQPDEIYRAFKVSKKKYKQALGSLYKSKRILLSAEKIQLVD